MPVKRDRVGDRKGVRERVIRGLRRRGRDRRKGFEREGVMEGGGLGSREMGGDDEQEKEMEKELKAICLRRSILTNTWRAIY